MMLYLKNLFLVIIALFLVNCCTTKPISNNNNTENISFIKEKNIIDKTRQSIVQIKTFSQLNLLPKTGTIAISSSFDQKAGSGSIVYKIDNINFILTASHVCYHITDKTIQRNFPNFDRKKHRITMTNRESIITTLDGTRYASVLVATSEKDDTCILVAANMPQNSLPISLHNPALSERVYSLNYPKGIWVKNYTAIFSGFLSSLSYGEDSSVNVYTLYSTEGSSGGVIININGEVIGMVHSYALAINYLTLSSTLLQIKEIIASSVLIYDINKQIINKNLIDKQALLNEHLSKIKPDQDD